MFELRYLEASVDATKVRTSKTHIDWLARLIPTVGRVYKPRICEGMGTLRCG